MYLKPPLCLQPHRSANRLLVLLLIRCWSHILIPSVRKCYFKHAYHGAPQPWWSGPATYAQLMTNEQLQRDQSKVLRIAQRCSNGIYRRRINASHSLRQDFPQVEI